jgi:hypothetical protein
MSTKRKKNSTNPAGKLVKFLKIHDESPWDVDWYMCGMCGHAVMESQAVRHGRNAHKAQRIELIAIEQGSEDDEDAKVLLPQTQEDNVTAT